MNDEIKHISKKNIVTGRSFAQMLEKAIKGYHNKTVEAAKIIEELIELGRKLRDENKRGSDLGLNEDEIAFYDALETNDSAVKVLGDDQLRTIARELVKTISVPVQSLLDEMLI
jgi:type I restriction enzyme R subunit